MQGNGWLGVVLLLAGLYVFFRRGRDTWDPFSPKRLYSAVWLFAVGLCQFRILNDEDPWRASTWAVVLLGYASFMLGAIIMDLMLPMDKDGFKLPLQPQLTYSDTVFKWLRGLIVFCALVLLLQYWVAGGIPVFSEDQQLRTSYAINSYVQRIALTVVPLTSLYAMLMVQKRQLRLFSNWKHYATLFFSILAVLSMESRFFLLVAFLPVMTFAAYYSKMPGRWKFMTRLVPLVLLVIYSRALLRSFSYFDLSVDSLAAQLALYLGPVYIAIVSHFQGLQHMIQMFSGQLPLRYGLGGSLDIVSAFLKGPLGLDYYGFAAFRAFNDMYINQYTHLGLAFADFGYSGVVIIGAIYGLASSWSYGRMFAKPTLLNMYCYGLITMAILLTIVTNLLLKLEFVYNILVVAIVLGVAHRQQLKAIAFSKLGVER